jgi:hypothetical protein
MNSTCTLCYLIGNCAVAVCVCTCLSQFLYKHRLDVVSDTLCQSTSAMIADTKRTNFLNLSSREGAPVSPNNHMEVLYPSRSLRSVARSTYICINLGSVKYENMCYMKLMLSLCYILAPLSLHTQLPSPELN